MPTTVEDSGWATLHELAQEPVTGPVWLDGDAGAYLVSGGPADLFAVRRTRPGVRARRHFVARVPEFSVVPATRSIGSWRLELVGLPETEVRACARSPVAESEAAVAAALTQPDPPRELTALQQAVVTGLDHALLAIADSVRDGQAPRNSIALQPRQILSVSAGSAITGNARVWWVRAIGGVLTRNEGAAAETVADGELTLFAGRDWLVAGSDCTVEAVSTADLLSSGQLGVSLEHFGAALLTTVAARAGRERSRNEAALAARKRADAAAVAGAARSAVGVLGARLHRIEPDHDARQRLDLYRYARAVLTIVTERGPVRVRLTEPPDRRNRATTHPDAIRAICLSSGLHIREVKLPPRWWREDLGPLIGWRRHGADTPVRAVALVFKHGSYVEVDPETRSSRRIEQGPAAEFEGTATQVQVPLPIGSTLRQALTHGLAGSRADIRGTVVAGLITATLGLATPVISGILLGDLAQNGSVRGLRTFLPLLLCSAFISAGALIVQNLHVLRLEGRAEAGTQLALWDRIMRLPVRFFRSMTSGELANAVLGISFVRESISGIFVPCVGASFAILGDLTLIFVVAPILGFFALGLIAACAALVAVLGRLVIRRARSALPQEHHATALTNQLLGGITKIKLAAAEDRAFAQWSEAHTGARGILLPVRRVQAIVLAWTAVLPILGQLLFFLTLAGPLEHRVSISNFFVVNVAFSLLLGAMLVLVAASIEIVAVVPRLEILQPIISAESEQRSDLISPGDLSGDITLASVSFGYLPDDPPVIEDVSLHIRPGAFVAIVGPSGCGKSTLLRLLLGFDAPRSGSVHYDDQDLEELDVQAVRRQCGVVLQDGQLFAGSLRENISGAGNFTLEEAWEAAALAGISEDIEAFPMGMATMVPVGGGTLSVGQRQRVLIARALIHRPRILFFDEATSSLDNRTQEIVTASTKKLAATRIVIAHRLSTIIDADQIVVMDHGRIVQTGDYQSLMSDRDGLFAKLAVRQLIELPGSWSADGEFRPDQPA
ncbi:ATP-binding cassette domain-containing protein [Jatrophihabitans sp.]|jgi:NHLM bacteriocin system ABC transporter ATP-binding protein|uniref:ATP-binding cassette domain-containing protein n=1 Tax=Jatrophihabitans sp. TaxID=1932789 RepID=UPI002F0507F2